MATTQSSADMPDPQRTLQPEEFQEFERSLSLALPVYWVLGGLGEGVGYLYPLPIWPSRWNSNSQALCIETERTDTLIRISSTTTKTVVRRWNLPTGGVLATSPWEVVSSHNKRAIPGTVHT